MSYDSEPAMPGFIQRIQQSWHRVVAIADEGRDALWALRSRLLLSCLLLTTGCLTALVVAELLWGRSDQWVFLSAMLVLMGTATFDYARAGRYGLYSHVLVGGLVALVLALIIASGGQTRSPQVSLPTLAMLAALLLSLRAALAWATVMLGGLWLSFFLRTSGAPVYLPLNPEWLDGAIERVAAVLVLVSIVLGSWCLGAVVRMHQRMRAGSEGLQEALKRGDDAEKRLEHFVEMASAWFWETDDQHRMVFLSAGFEKATGISPAQAIGLTPAEVMRIRYPNAAAADGTMRPMIERRGFKDQLLSWHQPLTGVINHYANSAAPVFDDKGAFRGFRGRVIDVSERAETIRQVRESVQGDFLTGLMSRRGMLESLDRALIMLRDAGTTGWWIHIDLDQFHEVNTRLNYAQGDLFLKRFARALLDLVDKQDALARMDGDSFGMLLLGRSREEVEHLATGVVALARGLRIEMLGAQAGTGSASLGATMISRATPGIGVLLQISEDACVHARDQGGSRIVFAK